MIKILEKTILSRVRMQLGIEDRSTVRIQIQEGHSETTGKSDLRSKNNFNINRMTAAILLDIEKAFDTVWHASLIVK